MTGSDCAWNGGECFRKDESTHCSYDGGDDSSYDSSGGLRERRDECFQ